ncbi:glycosyltransferase family 4 protein [Microbacterium sp. PRF11]|uniref:glycosyltransferase family 4 protein n=1 Tax=Microbacterium sp. PRF11 TaxID=2962593 RepID=UPI002881A9D7|nr:glycosyltransferase family 4 protein [Microbacterium sp. PRF11]MDT0117731.1 glycosyltransferase family 4 protein [Microbacterium sp. PRF11]
MPLIVYVRDLGDGGNRPMFEVLVYRFLLAVCARGVIFNSETTRDSWRLRLPSIVIPTAVDERYFAAPARDRNGGVIMVGRIARWKGQAEVISAMNALADSGFSTSLTIVGEKTFDDNVGLPEARFPVHLAGFSDPLDYLSSGELLVHASTTPEPFGQVLAQAAAVGIPIVCADRGGQTEWLTHNASCLMADPTRVDELASAIGEALSDRLGAEERAVEARSKAQMFRAEVAYEPVGKWLEEVCGR